MSDTIQRVKLPFNPQIGSVDSQFIELKTGDRAAKCGTCGRLSKSSTVLPHFETRPDGVTDYYYCGCRGWD